jgi:hypothetical protein
MNVSAFHRLFSENSIEMETQIGRPCLQARSLYQHDVGCPTIAMLNPYKKVSIEHNTV